MNILFVCAEVAPFVSVGGLSQVMYFLPRALTKLGHDVRIFTPKYGTMENTSLESKGWRMSIVYKDLHVPLMQNATDEQLKQDKKDYLICNIKKYQKKKKTTTYFLENREYYELRANVFGYRDDHVRFALLSKGCLEWLYQRSKTLQKDDWWPDVIHCNDWHTAYAVELARRDKRYKKLFTKTAVIFTVHNFAYQGNYDYRFAAKEDFDDGKSELSALLSPKLQKQNPLKRALLYADAVSTVSPTHAVEVLTPEYAEGLDETLQKIKGKLTGILNGLDTEEFNSSTDPIIKQTFNEKNYFKLRKINKADLQKVFLLPVDVSRPLFAFSGRLQQQKGLDILIEALSHLLTGRPEVQVIILGGGDDRYRNRLLTLQKEYPTQLGIHLQPDFRLPRKIFAGADFILIPSLYEPGGIVAFEALRYGAVPIVRRTGGLHDIIEDFNPVRLKGNGFSFFQKDAWALYGSMIEALTTYKQQKLWRKLVLNCLQSNFSWEKAAKEYDLWYKHVIEERKRAARPLSHPAYKIVSEG